MAVTGPRALASLVFGSLVGTCVAFVVLLRLRRQPTRGQAEKKLKNNDVRAQGRPRDTSARKRSSLWLSTQRRRHGHAVAAELTHSAPSGYMPNPAPVMRGLRITPYRSTFIDLCL